MWRLATGNCSNLNRTSSQDISSKRCFYAVNSKPWSEAWSRKILGSYRYCNLWNRTLLFVVHIHYFYRRLLCTGLIGIGVRGFCSGHQNRSASKLDRLAQFPIAFNNPISKNFSWQWSREGGKLLEKASTARGCRTHMRQLALVPSK